MENILIDTNIIINYLRAKNKSKSLLLKLLTEYNVSMSSISEFELYLGAKTQKHFELCG
jgi:tRNA(fMet)-specific endonuclease VapC